MTTFSLLILALLAPLSANSTTMAKPGSDPRWDLYFDGKPSQLSPDYEWDSYTSKARPTGSPFEFKYFVKGYSQCKNEIDHMLAALKRYDMAFRSADVAASEASYRELLTLRNPHPSCLEPVQRAYFVALLGMGPARKVTYESDNKAPERLLLATFLANQGAIQEMTPELREKWSGGKKTLWNEKKDGEYLLSGIYDCKHSQILLSSSLRPFNAAGSLAHELDHLYRDKYGFVTMVDWNKRKDIRRYIVADEMKASIYGAYFQRAMFLWDQAQNNNPIPDYTSQGNEFNLFKRGGPLSTLMDKVVKEWNLKPPVAFFEFYGVVHYFRDDPKVKKNLCSIQSVIRKGYFKKPPGECDLSGIFPEGAYTSIEHYIPGFFELRVSGALHSLLNRFYDFDKRLKNVSPVCEASEKAEKDGTLDDYIGKSLKKDGLDPNKPGNGGIKPCLKHKY